MATTSTQTRASAASLVAACDDRRLLGFSLWPMQRRLLEAVEGPARIHVWCMGRRSGKTVAAALVGIHACTLRPELRAYLRPGERGFAVAVATNLRQARLIVSAARSIVERSPLLAALVESVSDDEIVFTTGHVFASFPASSRGGRGWAIHTLILDEAAHLLDSDGNSAAESVWRALLPSTAQFREHGRVIAASTPFGQSGLFATLYQQASSGELSDAHAVQATTQEANPTVDARFLEAERARDPDGFASEYEARFVGGGLSFLDPERIADAVADRGELLPEQGEGWVAALDPSFSRDPFALALVAVDPQDRRRLLVGKVQAWLPRKMPGAGKSFDERRLVEDWLLNEVVDVCKQYAVSRVVTDQHAAPAVLQRLRSAGLRVQTRPLTAQSKSDAFSELRARLYGGTLELYGHADLLAELRRLRTRYAAGSASVVTPRVGGSHSDLAVALALAVHEHARHRPLSEDGPSSGWSSGGILGAFGQVDPRTTIRYGGRY